MSERLLFPYGESELNYLCACDSVLAEVIRRVGKIEREIRPDVFAALVMSVISQQISGKAAAAIGTRVINLAGGRLTPQKVSRLSIDSLRSCGLSTQKAGYILTAAAAALDGRIDFAGLSRLPDEKVIEILTALPGVGRWTAEMLLIFSLSRPDIISYNDFGIRKGLQLLYGLDKISKSDFIRLTEPYHPCATVASFYLWHIANTDFRV